MGAQKRILVTGGAGFLGAFLCERMVTEGHDVICLDNFFTSQKSNIVDLLEQPNFEFVRHDITHPIWLEVDEIYNLACPAAPGHYQFNPIKTLKTSVLGAINALGIAMVPEGRRVFPQLTVMENLEMGAYLRTDHAQLRTDLEEIFQHFPILKERRKQLAGTMSGGQQQMLAMGRALMSGPKVLLLDEMLNLNLGEVRYLVRMHEKK